MPSQRVSWTNPAGVTLAGVLELPDEAPIGHAVFAHCFTCSKDLKAIVRVSRHLASLGFAVLRFDFTGIGNSGGRFEQSNFETNVVDLKSAIDWLAQHHAPPGLIIGHSLGGAAAMALAAEFSQATDGPLKEITCLATLAAPSDTVHLGNFLLSQSDSITSAGQGQINIGGREWTITQQLIDSLRGRDLPAEIATIRLPHLILHSPDDQTVKWQHAMTLLDSGPLKSLVTLDGADHLLIKQRQDVTFVAEQIAVWAKRYL